MFGCRLFKTLKSYLVFCYYLEIMLKHDIPVFNYIQVQFKLKNLFTRLSTNILLANKGEFLKPLL